MRSILGVLVDNILPVEDVDKIVKIEIIFNCFLGNNHSVGGAYCGD